MSRSRSERQLILLSAGTAARRAAMRQQAERLAGAVDWARLCETLRARRLLTILGPRLTELAGAHAGEEFAETVRLAVDAGRRRGAFLQLISLHLTAALAQAGIRSTPLKGPLLGEALYGDAGMRPSSDIDLLVAPEQLRAAVAVVRELGYEEPTDHVDDQGLPLLHFKLRHARRELPPVELHWRVHWYERSFARERLLPPSAADGIRWRPAPAAELAALLLFYARDGFVDLRLATDVGAWWDTFGQALPTGVLAELIGEHPALARVLTVAVEVAERVVGVPAERILGERAGLALRDRAAIRLANPNPRTSTPQLYADMGMIDALLMPPGHLGAFVQRQLLPPREVLAERARRTQEPPSTRLGHGARVLGRYGLTITRLMHSPEALRLR